jgi:hypothetical protein
MNMYLTEPLKINKTQNPQTYIRVYQIMSLTFKCIMNMKCIE